MSTVCYCGRPDCSVTSMARDACLTTLRAERDEAVAALRHTTEALEGSFPGDESVGLPEFPEVSLSEAWKRREHARAVLAKYPEAKR